MVEEKLISVIVPVYNVREYLEQCVESILKQSYHNLEIILVDDGSTDGSGDICDALKKRDERIKVIHKVNGGLSDARNAGVQIAQGEYVGFVDADDYIDTKMYETLYRLCINYDAPIAAARWVSFGEPYPEPKEVTNDIVEMTAEEYLRMILLPKQKYYISMAVWDRLYKKNLIKDLSFPTGKIFEDIVYTTSAVLNAGKIIYVDTALYFYRIREDSISGISRKAKIDLDTFEKQLEQEVEQITILKKNGLSELSEYCEYDVYVRCLRFFAISERKSLLVQKCINDYKKTAKAYLKYEKRIDNKLRVLLSLISLKLYRFLEKTWEIAKK